MYKTILVPLDGSERAEKIVPYVEELAKCMGSHVVFLQVIEAPVSFSGMNTGQVDRVFQAYQQELSLAEDYVRNIQEDFRTKGIPTQACVEHGAVVETITKVAETTNADMIALASHGRTGLARVFYGSVAAGILNKTSRPIMVIRAETEKEPV